jgi:hypothetical protein
LELVGDCGHFWCFYLWFLVLGVGLGCGGFDEVGGLVVGLVGGRVLLVLEEL